MGTGEGTGEPPLGRERGREGMSCPNLGVWGVFGWRRIRLVKSAGFARNPPGMTAGGSCRCRGCPRGPGTPQGVTPAPLGATPAGGTGRVLAGRDSPDLVSPLIPPEQMAASRGGRGAARGQRLGPPEGRGPLSAAPRVPPGALPALAGVNSSRLDLISLPFARLSAPATPP